MENYISHISAALHWEIPFLPAVMGYHSIEELATASCIEQVTSDNADKRPRGLTIQSHVASLPLPKGAIVERHGDRVACPELVFLELAPRLGFHRTVLLGMQMCASDVGGTSLTSVTRIKRFLAKTQGHKGHRAALHAARYLADGSPSIMESLLFMLLTLPNMQGGYGLDGAVLNHKIPLDASKTALTGKHVFADLYWSKAKLVVEYDSYEYHAGIDSWHKDSRRMAAIERLGYKTLSVNTAQLYYKKAFDEVAFIIAAHLDKRIRIRTDCFAPAHAALRSLLPRASNPNSWA